MGRSHDTSKDGTATAAVHPRGSNDFEEGQIVDPTSKPAHTNLAERQLSDEEWAKLGQTRRGLHPRHAQLMAIGSGIGTGLFVGIGGTLSRAGPLSLLLGYATYTFLYIWPLNLCVGEMLAYLPVKGCIYELAGRYVDPAFGFALGWVYLLAGCMVLCTEYTAVAALMSYWDLNVNDAVWIAMCLVSCYLLNILAVRWYGETEFYCASAKILLILGLIFLTFITMVGGNPQGDAYGFRYWTDGRATLAYYTTGATGRFLGYFQAVRYAAFSIGGPDLIALAAGEIRNPRRSIPRVAKLVFARMMLFYVVGALAVGILCDSTSERLRTAVESGGSSAMASPWVVGIMSLGIGGLPTLINIIIVLSAWSAGNAFLYSTSRCLYSLARDGQAPKFFMKCTKAGVPIYCVTAVSLVSTVTFMVANDGAVQVFWWFVNLTTVCYLLVYTGYIVVFVYWYKACQAQSLDRNSLPYRMPYGLPRAYAAITLGCILMLFLGFDTFVPWDTSSFITSYFGVPFGSIVFFGYKFYKKTKMVKPAEADLYSGKAEIDHECMQWEQGGLEEAEKQRLAEMNVFRRGWEKCW